MAEGLKSDFPRIPLVLSVLSAFAKGAQPKGPSVCQRRGFPPYASPPAKKSTGAHLPSTLKFPRVQFGRRNYFSRPFASKSGALRRELLGRTPVKPTAATGFMERAMGIELTSEAWEGVDE